jgi:hypothetical protein
LLAFFAHLIWFDWFCFFIFILFCFVLFYFVLFCRFYLLSAFSF